MARLRAYLAARRADGAPPADGVLDDATAFQAHLRQQVARARRYRTKLSLVLIDVDRLRDVNRAHGDAVGDDLLQITIESVREARGSDDVVARYAPGGLALIAPGSTAAAVVMRARAIQEAAARRAGDRALPATPALSIGIADLDRAERWTADALFAAADQALSHAKTISRRAGGLAVAPRHTYVVAPAQIELLTD